MYFTSAERAVLDANIMARLRTIVSPATYPRPLGVHDAPHVGDEITMQRDAAPECACVELDLAFEATPAADDIRNALMILAAAHPSLIGDAVTTLIRSALAKLEAGA
jgi:hypothetical protein